jgi:hypothetical protein
MKFTIFNSQFSMNFQFSIFNAQHWPQMKIENWKLEIGATGGSNL